MIVDPNYRRESTNNDIRCVVHLEKKTTSGMGINEKKRWMTDIISKIYSICRYKTANSFASRTISAGSHGVAVASSPSMRLAQHRNAL